MSLIEDLPKRLREKLTKENLWIYVLALLSEKDMYGYEIRGAVDKRFNFLPGNVTAYRVLYALKKDELVDVIEKDDKDGKRKYYKITPRGNDALFRGKEAIDEIFKSL